MITLLVLNLGPIILIAIILIVTTILVFVTKEPIHLRQNEYQFKVTKSDEELKSGKLVSIISYIEDNGEIFVSHPVTHETVELTDELRGELWSNFPWMAMRIFLIENKISWIDVNLKWQKILSFRLKRTKYLAQSTDPKKEGKEDKGDVVSRYIEERDEIVHSLLHTTEYTYAFLDIEIIQGEERVSCFFVVRIYIKVTNAFDAIFKCLPAGSFNSRIGGLILEAIREYAADGHTFDEIAKEKTSFGHTGGEIKDKDGLPENLYSAIWMQNPVIKTESGHSLLNVDFLEFGVMPKDKEIEDALKKGTLAELNGKAQLTTANYGLKAKLKELKGTNLELAIIESYPNGSNMRIAELLSKSKASVINFPDSKRGTPPNITILIKENENKIDETLKDTENDS